jgi:hypothetical protein
MKKVFLILCFIGCFATIFSQTAQKEVPPDNGWWCAAEFNGGAFWYAPHVENFVEGFTFTNGYRFSEYIRLGIGFGVRATQDDYDYVSKFPYKLQAATLPLFLNARGNMMSMQSRKCVPFWNVDVGFAFLKNLFFLDAGAGMRVGKQRHSFVLSVNYFGQMVDRHYRQQSNFSNGIMVKLGYEF